MANISNPLPYITKREYGLLHNLKSQLFNKRLNAAKNLYRRDLVCHYGCVNAIEFSSNGELFVSGNLYYIFASFQVNFVCNIEIVFPVMC